MNTIESHTEEFRKVVMDHAQSLIDIVVDDFIESVRANSRVIAGTHKPDLSWVTQRGLVPEADFGKPQRVKAKAAKAKPTRDEIKKAKKALNNHRYKTSARFKAQRKAKHKAAKAAEAKAAEAKIKAEGEALDKAQTPESISHAIEMVMEAHNYTPMSQALICVRARELRPDRAPISFNKEVSRMIKQGSIKKTEEGLLVLCDV